LSGPTKESIVRLFELRGISKNFGAIQAACTAAGIK